jgi:hypothetical protein
VSHGCWHGGALPLFFEGQAALDCAAISAAEQGAGKNYEQGAGVKSQNLKFTHRLRSILLALLPEELRITVLMDKRVASLVGDFKPRQLYQRTNAMPMTYAK